MAESSLFNPGFLGGGFNWWIGQIADDSTWRDNNLPGKHQDKNTVPGWGRRYKVAIIGLHDQEEETIKNEELPWAQVMYPVTGGGGQTNASQTVNLRQGMFVFGFFLDGQDQQVPVIMGVLGNNTQTALGTGKPQRFRPTSGYSEGENPPPGSAKPTPPDEAKVISKPKSPEQAVEAALPPPNVTINKYGVRSDRPLTEAQLKDVQNATADADKQGLTGERKVRFIQEKVLEGIKNRVGFADSPLSPPQPGAVEENAGDAVHKTSAGDVKREEKYQEKIPLMKPDDKVGSAIKCIQIVLDNLTKKINKYLNAVLSYVDAVSNVISSLSNLIAKAACEIAKYMKIIFDKIMEYVMKLLNKQLTKVVSALPSSKRHMFADIKEILMELILCLYNKITNGLCASIEGLLQNTLKPDEAEQKVREKISKPLYNPLYNPLSIDDKGNLVQERERIATPIVSVCNAETLVGNMILLHKDEIDSANNTILNNINVFLSDIQSEISTVIESSKGKKGTSVRGSGTGGGGAGGFSAALPDLSSMLGGISASMPSALSFENLTLNLFGCELKPNVAVSDYYIFARGGASQPDSQLPFVEGVGNVISNGKKPSIPSPQEIPFAEPTKSTKDVDLSDVRTSDQIAASRSNLA